MGLAIFIGLGCVSILIAAALDIIWNNSHANNEHSKKVLDRSRECGQGAGRQSAGGKSDARVLAADSEADDRESD